MPFQLKFKMPTFEISFAILTLFSLWAYAGGQVEHFWGRILILTTAHIVMGAVLVLTYKLHQELKFNREVLRLGLFAALATLIPFVIVALLAINGSFNTLWPWAEDGIKVLKAPHFAWILLFSFVFTPAKELIYRGLFLREWKVGSVAILEALTVGFGTQHFFPFLSTWIMAYAMAGLRHRFGLAVCMTTYSLWTFVMMSLIYFST